jgi:hypothetical protein
MILDILFYFVDFHLISKLNIKNLNFVLCKSFKLIEFKFT